MSEADNIKVIFLDIDGVLNNEEHIVKIHGLLGKEQYLDLLREIGELPFDYRSCELLQKFTKETNVEVILSSTWRLNPEAPNIIKRYAGIEIKDITPRLHSIRGEEIQQYLDNHKEITNYVILDDDNDMLESQKEHFVKVNNKYGLTIKEIIQCENILK